MDLQEVDQIPFCHDYILEQQKFHILFYKASYLIFLGNILIEEYFTMGQHVLCEEKKNNIDEKNVI